MGADKKAERSWFNFAPRFRSLVCNSCLGSLESRTVLDTRLFFRNK
jgi:hypothetical protein